MNLQPRLAEATQENEKNAMSAKTDNRRAILINLSLAVFSVLFALLISEMALRLLGFKPLYVSPEREKFWRYDSLLGWAHQPGQEGIFETQQFRTNVRINKEGLRDREHTYQRQSDQKRILVLGDSFAWGYGVEEPQRFSQVLEKSMDVEVINAGVSGYSTDQELLWYRNEGIKYDADLVILMFTGNDIGDNEQQLVSTIYYKPRFIVQNGQLVAIGSPVPQTNLKGKLIYSLSQRSALAYFLIQRYFDIRASFGKMKANTDQAKPSVSSASADSEPFTLTTDLMHEIKNIAESRKAKFLIVTNAHWWNSTSSETYKDFVNTLKAEDFLVLDVESLSGFDPELMIIPDDGHWNQAGHQFAAEQIKAFIESHQLLDKP